MDRKRYLEIRKKHHFLQRDKFALSRHLLQDVSIALVVASWWTFSGESPFRFIAAPFLSVLIFRSFSMTHDAVHGLISDRRMTNELVGLWYGAICFLPFEPWRTSHLQHHYWSGNLDRDPVLMFTRNFPNFPRPLQIVLSFGWKYWIPIIGLCQQIVFWILAMSHFLKSPRNLRLGLSVLSPLLFWGSLALTTSWAFTIQIVLPAIVLYLIAVEVVNFPHHMQLSSGRGDDHLSARDQHRNARSCIYPRWFARFVALNFNYHIEHHMFPDAPWYVLDRLHELVEVDLDSEYQKDLNFDWILRNRHVPLSKLMENPSKTAAKNVA